MENSNNFMGELNTWMIETKPTNKYLAWLLLTLLRDTDTINPIHKKWVYKTAINYLRLPNKPYSDRNHDWYEDCIKLITAYRNSKN
jgi:hypothetical protein